MAVPFAMGLFAPGRRRETTACRALTAGQRGSFKNSLGVSARFVMRAWRMAPLK